MSAGRQSGHPPDSESSAPDDCIHAGRNGLRSPLRRRCDRELVGTRAIAMPRKGASAPTYADDRFDDSRHPRRTLASNGWDAPGVVAVRMARRTLAFRESERRIRATFAGGGLLSSPNSMRRGSAVRRTPLRRIRVSGGEGGTVSSSLSELGTVPGGVIGVGVKMGMLAGGNGLRCRCGEPGCRTEGW